MVKTYPEEFSRDVIAVARKGEATVTQVAKDFGVSVTLIGLERASLRTICGPAPTEV